MIDTDNLPGHTSCLNCGYTLDQHVWSHYQASHLCPEGRTEFNPDIARLERTNG